MKTNDKMEKLYFIANLLYKSNIRRVRLNYPSKGLHFSIKGVPIKGDFIILDSKKEPAYKINFYNSNLAIYKIDRGNQKPTTKLITVENYYSLIKNGKINVKELQQDESLLFMETDDLVFIRELLKDYDSSRKAIMNNFASLLALASENSTYRARAGLTLDFPPFHPDRNMQDVMNKLESQGIPMFIVEYMLNYLKDYRLDKIPPDAFAGLLELSAKEKEFLLYYNFIFKLIENKTVFKNAYVPFLGDCIFSYILASSKMAYNIKGYCLSRTETVWSGALLFAAGIQAQVQMKSPEEIITKNNTEHADFVFLVPPFEEYVTSVKILNQFRAYRLTPRKKEKMEILAMEHCLDVLEPGGQLFALMSHSFLTITTYSAFRKFVLDQAEVKAVISFPPGALQKRWGYQTDLVILQKRDPKKEEQADDKVFMAIVEEFSSESLVKTADKFKGDVL